MGGKLDILRNPSMQNLCNILGQYIQNMSILEGTQKANATIQSSQLIYDPFYWFGQSHKPSFLVLPPLHSLASQILIKNKGRKEMNAEI